MNADQRPPGGQTEAITPVLERNIEALIARRRSEEKQKTAQDRIADTITQFTGSMNFVYLHILIFGAWIIINLGLTPLPRFDPSFVILAMFASVEAIFLSTFVLISQNRMAILNDKRADLDLQISLLAEYEVTEILNLVVQMAETMDIARAHEPELQQLGQKVDPEVVLDRIDEQEKLLENPSR
jgi:uncharacterized membrane protein